MSQRYCSALLATLLSAASAQASTPAIPEPATIFYGTYTVAGAGAPSAPTSLTWTVTGNSETVQVSSFAVVLAGAETYYRVKVTNVAP